VKSAIPLLIASLGCVCACSSSDKSTPPPSTASTATVTIASPAPGSSFEITAVNTDIEIQIDETNFTLVKLGTEGTDMSQGQVRVYVDGMSCDDPGDGPMPVMVPYNRILPNDDGESTVGMDYCASGVPALDDKDHTMVAQLYHGETPLMNAAGATITDQIVFHTTWSDAAAGAAGSGIAEETDAGAGGAGTK
jgi:hypothetical protein